MKNIIQSIILLLCFSAFTGCVTSRKYDDLKKLKSDLESNYVKTKTELDELKAENERLSGNLSDSGGEFSKVKDDLDLCRQRYERLTKTNDDLNDLYEKMLALNKSLMDNSSGEKQQLTEKLSATELELDRKAIELSALEKELKALEAKLLISQKDLDNRNVVLATKEDNAKTLEAQLAARAKRVDELEGIIRAQDSKMQALKSRINTALLGFSSSDLSVENRNGKIYVSLSQNLLFKSGSTNLDSKGRSAIGKLSEVLNRNTDIDITIEGHTDNVPLNGSGDRKDNWDLSVLRSTSIVRVLTSNGVDPKRITASGRGEFFPVAPNGDALSRAQNRRTEIILAPKLDELYNVINQ